MVYLVASELTAMLPRQVGTITGSSFPLTIDEVGTIIARVSAELDGAAGAAGYAIPVPTTATQAYAQMQEYTEQGAGWRVLRRIFPGGGDSASHPLASDLRDAYNATLKALREGTLILIGAGAAAGEDARELPRSFQTSNSGTAVEAYASPMVDLHSYW
jgi:hypothetical protein